MSVLPPFRWADERSADGIGLMSCQGALNTDLRCIHKQRISQILADERVQLDAPELMQASCEAAKDGGSTNLYFDNSRYAVRRFLLEPGQTIEIHRHSHRRGQIVVVSGVARVCLQNRIFMVQASESVNLEFAQWHSIHNPGKALLSVLEIQCDNIAVHNDTEYVSGFKR